MGKAVLGRVEVSLVRRSRPMRRGRDLFDNVVIEAVIPAHRVGGDELLGIGIGANDVQLVLLITAPGIADKSFPGQQQAGIAVLRLNRNLAPVENGFAPVGGGPARIQIVESAVARFEPLLELRLGVGIERDVGILVVNLPAQYVGIVSETLGQSVRRSCAPVRDTWDWRS